MKITYTILLSFLISLSVSSPAHALLRLLPVGKETAPLFATTVEGRQKQLEALKAEYDQFTKDIREFNKETQKQLDALNAQAEELSAKVEDEKAPAYEFNSKLLSIVSEQYQTVIEIQQLKKQIKSVLELQIKSLEDYLKDPNFDAVLIENKAVYTFDILQEITRRVLDREDRLAHLEERKKNAAVDFENRKKSLKAAQAELAEVKRSQELFVSKKQGEEEADTMSDVSIQQEGQLLDAQEKLAQRKVQRAELRVQEAEDRIDQIDFDLFVMRSEFSLLKEEYTKVKKRLRVEQSDVNYARAELERKRQESFTKRDTFYKQIRSALTRRDVLQKQLNGLAQKYDLSMSDVRSQTEWTKDGTSVSEWLALCKIGNLSDQLHMLNTKRDFVESQIDLQKAKFFDDRVEVDIMEAWYKITSGLFGSDEEISQEVKRFQSMKDEIKGDLALVNDRRTTATNQLNLLNNVLDNLKVRISHLAELQNSTFKNNKNEYAECMRLLRDGEVKIRERIDVTGKLIELYSGLQVTKDGTKRRLSAIIAELSEKGFWRRSAEAVSWTGIKNIVPDIEQFLAQLRVLAVQYVKQFDYRRPLTWLKSVQHQPINALLLLLKVFICLFAFFALRRLLPWTNTKMKVALDAFPEDAPLTFGRWLLSLMSVIVGFVSEHVVGIFVWLVLFVIVRLEQIVGVFPSVLFYLLSIPYLLYLGSRFVTTLAHANGKHKYAFLSEQFHDRFFGVFSALLSATIIIIFFREALVLITDQTSDLPTILLALNFIIFQIGAIALISKDQILSLIPTKSDAWKWVYEKIDTYYYLLFLFVIGVIVMSNPYVGFFKQVLYVLSRLVLTALFVPIFFWAFDYLKQASSKLFFYREADGVKERFAYSKTWYGFSAIVTFVLLLFVGAYVGARIWGQPITIEDLGKWLNWGPQLGVDASGKEVTITMLDILQVVGFMLAGLFLTFLVNRFVLRRVFELLVVDLGVQSTLFSLVRYFILITAFVLGLQHAGLGSLMFYIGGLLLGIGWAIKEFITDFFSYFIILVQRPIKIGDYVIIDPEVQGVVRQITPRSVILRRKNSFSIIVPNTQFISKPVVNLNYTRTFSAFNDLLVTVSYDADPKQVRDVILGALSENTSVLKSPAPIVRLHDLGDNGLVFLVRGFLSPDKIADRLNIAAQVRMDLVDAFHKAGIALAFPTRVLKLEGPNVAAKIKAVAVSGGDVDDQE